MCSRETYGKIAIIQIVAVVKVNGFLKGRGGICIILLLQIGISHNIIEICPHPLVVLTAERGIAERLVCRLDRAVIVTCPIVKCRLLYIGIEPAGIYFSGLVDFPVDFVILSSLKVSLDLVANHTSPDAAWVTEKPADWYYRDSLGNTIVEYDWTDIAKLNYANKDLCAEMADMIGYWVAKGVDGFRCDVGFQVPAEFWTPTIAGLREKAGRPLYWLAEAEVDWMYDAGFDCQYGWKLYHIFQDIVNKKADADSLARHIQSDYIGAKGNHLTFITNHDENSWTGTEFQQFGDAWKALEVLCFTLPGGQPLIYTGQEVGWNKQFEFFEKDITPDWTENEFTGFYKYLTSLRHDNPALGPEGGYELVSTADSTIVFKRTLGDNCVTVSAQLTAPWNYNVSVE